MPKGYTLYLLKPQNIDEKNEIVAGLGHMFGFSTMTGHPLDTRPMRKYRWYAKAKEGMIKGERFSGKDELAIDKEIERAWIFLAFKPENGSVMQGFLNGDLEPILAGGRNMNRRLFKRIIRMDLDKDALKPIPK